MSILNSNVIPVQECGDKVLASAEYKSYPAASTQAWTGSLADLLLA